MGPKIPSCICAGGTDVRRTYRRYPRVERASPIEMITRGEVLSTAATGFPQHLIATGGRACQNKE